MRLKNSILMALTGLVVSASTIFFWMYLRFGKFKETAIETNFDIIVEKSETYRGYLYINDSLQIGSPFLYNDSSRIELEEFVQIGDRMIKTKGTEEISLIRDDSVYVFRRWVAPKGWH